MNQLTELRNIIVGEQQEQLELLKKRLEESQVDALKVANVLPDSVRLSLQAGGQLKSELKPFIAESVMQTVEKNPKKFAEVLYPVILPAVKLMIGNSIRLFIQSMNRGIESATTLTGLKWRFEAMQKGVPYSEVALQKTLKYRVEQVYLIDRDGGLLIEHLINENVQGLDSDAVAGMFSAIQSFVRDSFQASSEENLTQMNVGELNVLLFHQPVTTLACVVRGVAPYEFHQQLDQVHDQIYKNHATQINAFDGTQGSINGIKDMLEPYLRIQLKETEETKKKPPIAAYIAIAAIAIFLGVSGFLEWRKQAVMNKVENLLYATPGILPTRLQWINKKLHINGLAEEKIVLPWSTLHDIGVTESDVVFKFKTYQVGAKKNITTKEKE